jgi:hypothetical protein
VCCVCVCGMVMNMVCLIVPCRWLAAAGGMPGGDLEMSMQGGTIDLSDLVAKLGGGLGIGGKGKSRSEKKKVKVKDVRGCGVGL